MCVWIGGCFKRISVLCITFVEEVTTTSDEEESGERECNTLNVSPSYFTEILPYTSTQLLGGRKLDNKLTPVVTAHTREIERVSGVLQMECCAHMLKL